MGQKLFVHLRIGFIRGKLHSVLVLKVPLRRPDWRSAAGRLCWPVMGSIGPGYMFRIRSIWPISVLILCAALAGCGGSNQFGSQTQNNGNSSVVLAMTDLPPSTVSVLAAQVTLTGATLAPGNVSLFSGSTTIELTRLQTDIAYLATASNVPAGSYTSVSLTFANPVLTIENDTGSAIVSGATSCAVGAICTIAPTSVANLATTINLSSFSIAANTGAGLLVDVNLNNLLSSTL